MDNDNETFELKDDEDDEVEQVDDPESFLALGPGWFVAGVKGKTAALGLPILE